MLIFALWSVLLAAATQVVEAQVTVYGQTPKAQLTATSTSGQAPMATLHAYDTTVLTPPSPPNPPITQLTFAIPRDAASMPGLSIPHTGSAFFGFSVEMSVITQILGKNSTHIFVPFLNLMSNIQERAGSVMIRMGGNTQEFAKFYDGQFNDGRVTHKEDSGSNQTTQTPAVMYTKDLFYMAANISSLLDVKWFLGLPFNDTSTFHLEMAEYGQSILGDNLLALQAGNEPDLYAAHGKRPQGYSPYDYVGELYQMLQAVDANPNVPVKNKFVGPSISQSEWTPEQVWDTGFIANFKDRLYALTVERYLNNNCFAQFGSGTYQDPQANFPNYLTHDTHVGLLAGYLNSTQLAQAAGLPFMMFETNTASCGGFPGISQSFGAGMWVLDYGLQMAYSNFSHALLHLGGQNVYYNPWISPPTNQSSYNEWTVGSTFYAAMIAAEVFGKSDTGRIMDLHAQSPFTPAYAIYERDTLSKVALFNYIDDTSGANNINAAISIPNAGVPETVKVKYFLAESVASKANLTWAGQTFGNNFEADGRLKGNLNVTTIQCDRSANVCNIPLRAPSFALVFMDSNDSEATEGQATATFVTTAFTKAHNTVKVDPAVLATSNGHSGKERERLAGTSHGSITGGAESRYGLVSSAVVLMSTLAGACLMLNGLWR
ncbi:glycoside hydrolase family 79 protein [Ephemerocybe angulata]|uniref:Glycoside hydrolase family 79 protein n=1 Tax=Ephemerocybe angulata TaxID=980116 RepID=A0A8H6LTJ2_9AGAR|nr:glycoside hydrolase family 79 protein [Tulosesus angulatus]